MARDSVTSPQDTGPSPPRHGVTSVGHCSDVAIQPSHDVVVRDGGQMVELSCFLGCSRELVLSPPR
jgi:hypothetical protein